MSTSGNELEPSAEPSLDRQTTKRGGPRCQVCAEPIAQDSPAFFKRYRICRVHAAAEEVEREGVPSRFCQQCGRFHALSDFDGPQRSCRSQLAYHAARRRQLRRKRAAACLPSDSATLSLDSGGGEPPCEGPREVRAEQGQSCSSAEAGGPSSPFPLTTRVTPPAAGAGPVQPRQQQQQQQGEQGGQQPAGADWTQLSFLASAAANKDAVQANQSNVPAPAGEEASQLLQLQHSVLSSNSATLDLGSLILQQQLSGVLASAAPLASAAAPLFSAVAQQRAPPTWALGPSQQLAEAPLQPEGSSRVSEGMPFPSWGCKRPRLAPFSPATAAAPPAPGDIAALAAPLRPAPTVLKPTPRLPAPVLQQQRQPALPAAVAALAGLGLAELQGLSPATAAALVQLELEKRRCAASLRKSFLRQLQAVVQSQAPAPAVAQVVCTAAPPAPSPFADLAAAVPAAAPLNRLLGVASAAPAPTRPAAQPALLPQQTAALLSCLASCLRQ